MSSEILENEDIYQKAGEEFVVRFCEFTARLLHNSPLVAFSLDDLTVEAKDLLFDVCFFSIAQLEEKSGIACSDDVYLPRPAFDVKGSDPLRILIGAAQLHGRVGDETLEEAIRRARERNGKT